MSLLRLTLTPLLLVLAWAAWTWGGLLLEPLGLGLLDVPGRICLVFGVLGMADALLVHLLPHH